MPKTLLIAIILFSLTACGKKGALYYPDMLVPDAPAKVSAGQTGESVKLQFEIPGRDLAGRKLVNLAGFKINRRQSSINEQTCSSCMNDYALFRKLHLDQSTETVQRSGSRIILLDGDVSHGKTYSYRITPFTNDGVDGVASPPASLLIVKPVSPPTIDAESFPTEIRISFGSLPQNSGSLFGYNVYRSKERDKWSYLPLNSKPLTESEYIDSNLERDVKYYYAVRSVMLGESGGFIESLPSNLVEVMLKNDD